MPITRPIWTVRALTFVALVGTAALAACGGVRNRAVNPEIPPLDGGGGAISDGPSDAGTADVPAAEGPSCPPTPTPLSAPGAACTCDNECSSGFCQAGTCCGGAGCNQRPLGSMCEVASQCESGVCADGVCCNQPCTGSCLSCNQVDRMGECAPVPSGGLDPHGVCRKDAPDSCGQTGYCNGQGGCAKYASGTVCGAAGCPTDSAFLPAAECDGSGTCVPGQTVDCAPFTCDSGACRVSCQSNEQCLAPNVCASGSCGLRGKGQVCTSAAQCGTGFCVDGVCCDSACTGTCSYCANPNARGTCALVRADTPDPRAAAGVTDPNLICVDQGPSSCGSNGRCDGKGQCARYGDGTVCKAARCDTGANAETSAAVCSAGTCRVPAAQTCAPYHGCRGAQCLTDCTSDAQCAAGSVCTNGSCGKRPVGSLCSRDSDCGGPGICAQGRCCASACNGTCMACNLAGAPGTCAPVPAGGADPTGACRDDACNNGCDGHGGCRREAVGSTCKTAACASGTTLTSYTCTMAGVCQPASAACPSGQVCMNGRCAPPAKQPTGGTCVSNDDCESGACTAGHCCASSCAGACKVCSAATMWSCANRPNATPCGLGLACMGGMCVASCPGGRTSCGGSCVDLANDPANCGACGTKCPSGRCTLGKCAATCPPNQQLCGAACVDLRTDPNHCGSCTAAPCASGRCVGGQCVPAPMMCPMGRTRCPAVGGICVDLQTNRANCGSCGNVCRLLQICKAGVCVGGIGNPPP